MTRRWLHGGLLAVFLGVFLWGLNARYPLIGEDYYYVFPRLLEGKWHFLRQGFAPLRFAPHLCGGFPQYGNPQDHFYSLPQMFSFFLDLWSATLLSVVLLMITGYVGWVRFGQDVLRLSREWSHLLALVCLANGFYFVHMLVGHLWVVSLPLLSWILWFLFHPEREGIRMLWIRALLFTFLTSYILYSGSQTFVFLAILIAVSFLPFDLLLAKRVLARSRTLLRRFAAFGLCTLMLCASKLVAIYSLMHTLRVKATFSGYHAGESIVWFMFRSFWALPQSVSSLAVPDVPFSRIQEESVHTPYIVLLGLFAFLFFWVRDRHLSWWRRIALVVHTLVLFTFILLLVRGIGVVPEGLQRLPFFSALRVPERFLFILSILLTFAGILGAAAFVRAVGKPGLERCVVPVLGAFTIAGFLCAYVPMLRDNVINVTMPYDEILQLEHDKAGYLDLPVTEAYEPPPGKRISDFHYLFLGSTGTQCYEAITLELPQLKNGPVDLVYDGAFNIYNPACLQYPEANHCAPRDRIREDDRLNFFRFINGEATDWKRSALQIWADRLTILSLIVMPLSLIGLFAWSLRKRH